MEQIVWIDNTGSTLDYREPIIRCKNCLYFQEHRGKYLARRIKSGDGICKYHNYEVVVVTDYCSRAERKEE